MASAYSDTSSPLYFDTDYVWMFLLGGLLVAAVGIGALLALFKPLPNPDMVK